MENRIKEQQLDLFADRTSTSEFRSNQVRLYFSTVAYTLLHVLRRVGLEGTDLERAQCGTIRLKLLNIGAQVRVTFRKVWISMASGYPYIELFAHVFRKLGGEKCGLVDLPWLAPAPDAGPWKRRQPLSFS